MKSMTMVIFISIFFLITGLISLYIFIRGLQSIPPDSSLRTAYIIVFWTIACSFAAGRLLERFAPSLLADVLVWIGSFWLGAMIYFLIALVALDLMRLANNFLPFFPAAVTANYGKVKYVTGASVLGLVGIVLLAGYVNSITPRVVALNLSVAAKASKLKHLNIVAVSDIHLGIIVGRSRFDRIVDKINRMDPDLVLLLGDIVDEELAPVIRQNLGESLRSIQSRFGVFAITGNHEYIGGAEEACSYLAEHKVTLLRDQSLKVADSFFLVGREDQSSSQFPPFHKRKELAQLMESVDRNYPVILMDHQPFKLNEAAVQGIDLQLSGHTHYGQLWPINYIVNGIYELAWGYRKIAGTQYYVSDGVGTWGPPVRIGNRPEIVNIRIKFE
ncbi:MAG: metallophosphoesterase [Acidobacteriota bacterium]|jgi:predicted MPP superfamily phosphohydrolase